MGFFLNLFPIFERAAAHRMLQHEVPWPLCIGGFVPPEKPGGDSLSTLFTFPLNQRRRFPMKTRRYLVITKWMLPVVLVLAQAPCLRRPAQRRVAIIH
jgi:hypothetical protein